MRPDWLALLCSVAAVGCGGGDDSSREGSPGPALVIVSDVDNPPPADEGFLEGLVRLELYAIDLEGGAPIRLTDNELMELGPACSPDGTRVAFTSGEREVQVEVMSVDGTGRRRVATGFHPDWSPDGELLVFARDTKPNSAGLFVASAEGGGERPLLDGPGNDHWPSWSPQGDRIAFLRAPDPEDPHHDLYVVDADGTGERLVLRDVDGGRVSWSPDGIEIALARTVGGHAGIWIVDVESGDTRKLTPAGQIENPQAQPAWSPDGDLIAFEDGGIALVKPDGSEYRPLPLEPLQDGIAHRVTWSDPTWCGRR